MASAHIYSSLTVFCFVFNLLVCFLEREKEGVCGVGWWGGREDLGGNGRRNHS